jgi:SpoVK/Ycf46/Vps4 family AAA+-type ATPase
MTQTRLFESETVLPDEKLTAKASTLLGFDARYARIRDQLRLLLNGEELAAWNRKHHGGKLSLIDLVADQYPLAIFYGDVGTGKSLTAECTANRLVAESRTEDAVLFKLSNRVRGSGKVGEMGTLLTDAFQKIGQAAGRGRRAVLIIDEGDSLAAARSQDHSHHEDKVAVNTLIQGIDDLRRYSGRIVTILCTNRVTALDPAFRRRAAILEEFRRPTADERRQLFAMDLAALGLSEPQLGKLVAATGARDDQPDWTYSDIRTRLYPAALAAAFPERPLQVTDLLSAAVSMKSSPAVEDR